MAKAMRTTEAQFARARGPYYDASVMRRFVFIVVSLTVGFFPVSLLAVDCSGPVPGPCALCKRFKAVFVGTALKIENGAYRFRVEERFKGAKDSNADVYLFPGAAHLEIGKQYLVTATPCPWEGAARGCLITPPCSGSLPVEYAQATIEQLRAEKNGKRAASVYGMLWRTEVPWSGILDEGYRRPLAHIVVHAKSGKKSFEAVTDERGAYAFKRLPAGSYQVSADLPPHLALTAIYQRGPVSFDLPRRSCYDYDLYASPTGRISGRLIGPDGKQLRTASVYLCTLGQYTRGYQGAFGYQGENLPGSEWRPFKFDHLSPGDYVLVFNPQDRVDPDAPFPATFYPHAANLEKAQILHLADGQQIMDADIRLANPLPTRQITVRIAWNGRKPQEYYGPQVIVEPSRGMPPYAFEAGENTYTLNLLLNAQYKIYAQALCHLGTTGKAKTNVETVKGSDPAVSEVTLTFDKGACTPK
jgi:hypothetical protein